jgi:hypothetical protein
VERYKIGNLEAILVDHDMSEDGRLSGDGSKIKRSSEPDNDRFH